MKKVIFILITFVSLIFTSCSNDYNDLTNQYNYSNEKQISIIFNGDFQYESFTRSSDISFAKDIWIFDYMNDELIQTVHQNYEDDNFGTPQIKLKYGTHKMYFLMSGGDTPNHMQYIHTITWQKMGDTFWGTATAEIKESSRSELRVMLDRVVSMIKINSIDNKPENAKYIKVIPEIWHYGINYLTGKPETYSENREILFELDDNNTSNLEICFYGTAAEEESIQLQIFSLSQSKNVIKYIKFTSVPFMVNRITKITTKLFDNTDSGDYNYNFITNSAWNTGYVINK